MWIRLPVRIIVMLIKAVILPIIIYILGVRVFKLKNYQHNKIKKRKIKLRRKNRTIV